MADCFVVAPIGPDGSAIRARSDQIFNHVITPVAKDCGFEAIRADKISEPGLITTQVIDHLLNDAVVVADLTGNNANVFYELAVRHAIRKPYVQIIQKGERIPFDVAGVRTIEIDHTNLDSVATAKEEMARQIRFTTTNEAKIESPISVAIDFEKLRKSDDPAKRQLADILKGMNEIGALVDRRLASMEKRLVEARIMDIDIAVRRIRDDARRVPPPEWITRPFREKFMALVTKVETAPPEDRANLISEAAAVLKSYSDLPPIPQAENEDEQQEK